MGAGQSADGASWLSVESLAYLGLILVALILRVSGLNDVPLSAAEAKLSLSAWHIVEDDAPGLAAVASSPLTHIGQILTFSTLGPSAFSARIGSALAGIALALTPLLFREIFGSTRTFIWCALLTVLTVPVAASRTADGTTIMLLSTMLAIWMIRRYWYSRRLRDATWSLIFVTFMLVLSSPGGLPLLLILLLAGWLAVWRTALSAPQRLELPGDDILQLAVKRLRGFPLAKVLLWPMLVTVLVATLGMLYPAGLRTLSHLLNDSLVGITQSHAPDDLRLGVITLISNELLLIVFAIGGAWLLWEKGDVTYIDRFAAAWAVVGALGLLLYPGAHPADALWVVLPLTLLASYGVTQLMVNRRTVVIWSAGADADLQQTETSLFSTSYWWVKWVLSVGVLFFLLVLSVQVAQVARLMLSLPADTHLADLPGLVLEPTQARLLQGIGLFLITSIIATIVFLLMASFWGMSTTLQGLGLGFCWFMLLSGLGGAWQAALTQPANPDGLWRTSAVADDIPLLRETLFELADRESSGFPLLEFTIVQAPDAASQVNDIVAWLTRDFPNARFVQTLAEVANPKLILLAEEAPTETLTGDYVGQRFVVLRNWSLKHASVWDLPAWWSQRRIRDHAIQEQALILWLRQDVYDGVP